MIFCGNVAGVDGRDRSSFSDLAKQFVAVHYPELCGRGTHKHTHTSLSPFASLPSSLPLSLRTAVLPQELTKHSAASSMKPSWKRCSSLKVSAKA